MDEQSRNEYASLRKSIRALEAEIDGAYVRHMGDSVMVRGGGQDSPKDFFLTQSSLTAPMADSICGESLPTTHVPSTFVEWSDATIASTNTASCRPIQQGPLSDTF